MASRATCSSDRGRSRALAALLAAIALAPSLGFAEEPQPAPAASPAPAPPEAPPADGTAAEDRPVDREDLLEISVFEIPELSRTVRVSEKGTISLPLLGDVDVRGLTPRQVELRLRERLSEKYLQNPQVSIFVREHGSKRVSVLGAVGRPGVYEMLGPRTLLQVLAEAGGLTREAGSELYLIRSSPGGEASRIVVDVEGLLASRSPDMNVPVQPGDVISVPLDRVIYVYVDGAVKAPGRIEQPASRPITLLQAMAKAGGATDRANLKKVQILRRRPGGAGAGTTTTVVNARRIREGKEPDPALQDGDVIVVPETFF